MTSISTTAPPGGRPFNPAQVAKEQAALDQIIETKNARKLEKQETSIAQKAEKTALKDHAAKEKAAQGKQEESPAAKGQPGEILNIVA